MCKNRTCSVYTSVQLLPQLLCFDSESGIQIEYLLGEENLFISLLWFIFKYEKESLSLISWKINMFYYSRINRQKKTMKLSRALSDLVKYTKSVGIHDVETESRLIWKCAESNWCANKLKDLCSILIKSCLSVSTVNWEKFNRRAARSKAVLFQSGWPLAIQKLQNDSRVMWQLL